MHAVLKKLQGFINLTLTLMTVYNNFLFELQSDYAANAFDLLHIRELKYG